MAAFEEGFSEEQARRAANGGGFSGFHFENGEAGDFWDDMFGQFFEETAGVMHRGMALAETGFTGNLPEETAAATFAEGAMWKRR